MHKNTKRIIIKKKEKGRVDKQKMKTAQKVLYTGYIATTDSVFCCYRGILKTDSHTV